METLEPSLDITSDDYLKLVKKSVFLLSLTCSNFLHQNCSQNLKKQKIISPDIILFPNRSLHTKVVCYGWAPQCEYSPNNRGLK